MSFSKIFANVQISMWYKVYNNKANLYSSSKKIALPVVVHNFF